MDLSSKRKPNIDYWLYRDSSVLEIPSVINNKIVSRIEEEAFLNYTSLTKVIIPDTVTYIGRAAFKDCNNLQEIILSNNIAEITKELFMDVQDLIKLTCHQ